MGRKDDVAICVEERVEVTVDERCVSGVLTLFVHVEDKQCSP